ncbi:MAG TPA: hypothetical protein VK420_15090 [Longimicrobium sp.]|nr:hypothetical protein [Longimicrobium sp.]
MGRWGIGVALILAAGVSAAKDAAKDAAGRTLEVWVSPAAVRLEASGVPEQAASAARLSAVRGERESFFLVVRGDMEADEVEVAAPRLSGAQGSLPEGSVRVYRAGYVAVDGRRRVADALVPEGQPLPPGMAPGRGENVAFFVEVAVPRRAQAGRYDGALRVRMNGWSMDVPVHLQIFDVELPQVASLPSAFDFSAPDAARAAGLAAVDPAGLEKLGRGHALAALESRISLVAGSGAAPRYRLLPGEGALELDFTDFDRELGPLLDGVPELEGARASTVTLRMPRELGVMGRFKYALALREHLVARGWGERLVDLAESSPLEAHQAEALAVRRVEARGWDECLQAARARRPVWWRIPERDPEGSALGLGAEPVSIRAIGWLAWRAGAAGLRYGPARGFAPQDGSWRSLFHAPGAMGTQGRPAVIESVRLKLLRDGLEDYELLAQVAQAGQRELADGLARKLASSPRSYRKVPEAYDTAKVTLAQTLERLRAPAVQPAR